jgi:hypothetical protein
MCRRERRLGRRRNMMATSDPRFERLLAYAAVAAFAVAISATLYDFLTVA